MRETAMTWSVAPRIKGWRLFSGALALGLLTACASPTATRDDNVASLSVLGRTVLAEVKAATSGLASGDNAAAATQLDAIGRDGAAILSWLDAHAEFAAANQATVCLRETMTDLGEQAETLTPLLRAGTIPTSQLDKLRVDLGEAANCIQSGD